ncbi:MAG: ThuA domain-containing protein [Bryobacterales bacterium]|jgi:type 1 glutamine amidotransferase|nr:ThuA domain-containing protein [Bryobacterales bacterium]
MAFVRFITLVFFAAISVPLLAADPAILVYTRNFTPDGKGYVHDNIADSVAAIRKLGEENGFTVDHSDDPAVFTAEGLGRYAAIVFSNSNNEAFATDQQREAFQQFLRSGKGFVGIHSATGSERRWPWYWAMIGGSFDYHPPMQAYTIRVASNHHPATAALPAQFVMEDECYFHKEMNPAIIPLLVVDQTRLRDDKRAERRSNSFGTALPVAWYHHFEGAHVFYTGLGHKKDHYRDPRVLQVMLGGIQWAIGNLTQEASQ